MKKSTKVFLETVAVSSLILLATLSAKKRKMNVTSEKKNSSDQAVEPLSQEEEVVSEQVVAAFAQEQEVIATPEQEAVVDQVAPTFAPEEEAVSTPEEEEGWYKVFESAPQEQEVTSTPKKEEVISTPEQENGWYKVFESAPQEQEVVSTPEQESLVDKSVECSAQNQKVTYFKNEDGVYVAVTYYAKGDKVFRQTSENVIPYDTVGLTTIDEAKEVFDNVTKPYENIEGIYDWLVFSESSVTEMVDVDYRKVNIDEVKGLVGTVGFDDDMSDGVSLEKSIAMLEEKGYMRK
ncbi:hypothetical protein Hs30E_13750 [Lactococcus hodotermopsidis]|uniref:Uncharacterized protein n=1 Tax=Pseudolactococcus hodotermopsidis TaxID=2709157 RepID=A0A6A0BEA7_9LACT|nr:YehR family protein [Lactococcus hodotermopsidis]GFH42824.1 hypothetical protein Hs30E_13750 [Lactococcus hodotermopsidis]